MRVLLSSILLTAIPLAAQTDAAHTAFGLWQEGPTRSVSGGGPTYRVECGAEGFSFVPALPTAPRLYPLVFSFASLQRGADLLVPDQEVAPRSSEDTVCYDRGAGLVERYRLSSIGVKQSFVLQQRPSGRGDLVVRQHVVTDLVADKIGDCSEGLRFLAPAGHGLVELGAAVAVDAAGVRHAMTMHYDGDVLELRLAAEGVDASAYPLVLDPPIGTTINLTANDDKAPDVAWNEPTRRYLVVWQRRLSATVVEIFGQLLDERLQPVTTALPLSTGIRDVSVPTVASYGVRSQFCVVWHRKDFFKSLLDSRVVDATTGGMSAVVGAATGTSQNFSARLAATPGKGDDRIVLVHRNGSQGIRVQPGGVSPSGQPEWFSSQLIPGSTGGDWPAISESSGGSDHHLVAWEVAGPNGTSIVARVVDGDGLTRSGPMTVSSGLTLRSPQPGAPDVDGDGEDFFVVFHRQESTGSSDQDVFGRVLHYDGGSQLTAATGVLPIEADAGEDESDPAVAYLAGQFLVAFEDDASTDDVIFQKFSIDGMPCGPRTAIGSPFSDDHDPVLASQSGPGAGDEAVCVFLEDPLVPVLPSGLRIQRFQAYVGGSATSLGGACGNGGATVALGVFAAGNSAFALELQGADPSALNTVLVLGASGPPLSCGSCSILNPAVSIGFPLVNGGARLPMPLACGLQTAAGAVMEAQWLTFGTVTSPCPLLPGLSASDRLQLTLGR